ncbi:MAG TPA: hypothetical protein VEV82_05855 [Actinomycetota bacterium]|nr:hypothetical protein [Actinomycetota bacterium]
MILGSSSVRLGVGAVATVVITSLAVPATSGGSLQPMKESGGGTFDTEASGCEGSVDTCQKFVADAHGRPIDGGSLVLKLGYDMGQGFFNPHDKQCVDAVGEGTFRKGENKIFISFEGPFCEGNGPTYIKLYYVITGGQGRFDLAQGRGGIFAKVGSDSSFRSDGTIKI